LNGNPPVQGIAISLFVIKGFCFTAHVYSGKLLRYGAFTGSYIVPLFSSKDKFGANRRHIQVGPFNVFVTVARLTNMFAVTYFESIPFIDHY